MPLNLSRSAFVKTLALSAIVTPLWSATALAWSGDDVAKRLQTLLKDNMIELTYSKADTQGQTLTLHGAEVRLAADNAKEKDSDDSAPLNLGKITLSGISEGENNTYLIDKASFDDIQIVEDDEIFTTSGMRFEKIKLPEKASSELLEKLQYVSGFYIDEMTVATEGEKLFELSQLYLTQDLFSEEKPGQYSWGFKTLNMDLEAIDRIDRKNNKDQKTDRVEDSDDDIVTDIADDEIDIKKVRALGLEKINLSMDAKASWSPYTGEYKTDKLTISGENIGTYHYKVSMGGYDLKFIKAMQQLFSDALDDNKENTAMQIAAVGMMQNLSIGNLEMRYDDAGFVNKLLDYEAQKRGLSREDFVLEIKDQLAVAIAYFENEPRVIQTVTAIGNFLDKPHWISVKLEPEQPVTVGIMTAVGMADPKKLWSVLGVNVEAGQ